MDRALAKLNGTLSILDFAQTAIRHIIDKSADCNLLRNPGMAPKLLQLVADIFLDVLERVEEGWGDGCSARAILDSSAQILLVRMHQTAIGMIDDHDFLGAKEIVRYNQRAQCVVRYDTAGISYDVRIPGLQT